MEKPQLVIHIEKNFNYNMFDVKWVPSSARLVVMGCSAQGKGKLEILEMSSDEVNIINSTEYESSLKCGTFRASGALSRQLAFGDFGGNLKIVDLTKPEKPIYSVSAHKNIVNAVDGVGGLNVGEGAAELVTGGSDSIVNVWDPRLPDEPVVNILPQDGTHRPDCWTVAAGNAFTSQDRCIAAGFDNGDIKLFDLRNSQVLWETNVRNGVCSLEFDRRDIEMNKLVATTLGAYIHVFDLRTFDDHKRLVSVHTTAHNSTVWCVKHLPQDRDIWITTGGNGSLNLWRYRYPAQRIKKTANGGLKGMPGTLECLQSQVSSTQPITSFDWSSDKKGLGAFTSIDQTLRIIVVTKLQTL
uniref:WD repeat-containing protein 92-like n=2 Tax=Hirondellea gigas TaxID=1518452 RepID=A0A2P2IDD9_9CRUS